MKRLHLAVVLLAAGCKFEPEATDYDATCAEPDDCVATIDVGYCGACDTWVALSVDGAEEFRIAQEVFGEYKHCQGTILPNCDLLIEPPEATCEGEVCALAP